MSNELKKKKKIHIKKTDWITAANLLKYSPMDSCVSEQAMSQTEPPGSEKECQSWGGVWEIFTLIFATQFPLF